MNDKKFISFYYDGHDPNISVYSEKTDSFFCIELERLLGIRYLESGIPRHCKEFVLNYLKNVLKNIGFDENFDEAFFVRCNDTCPDFGIPIDEYKKCFNIKKVSIYFYLTHTYKYNKDERI